MFELSLRFTLGWGRGRGPGSPSSCPRSPGAQCLEQVSWSARAEPAPSWALSCCCLCSSLPRFHLCPQILPFLPLTFSILGCPPLISASVSTHLTPLCLPHFFVLFVCLCLLYTSVSLPFLSLLSVFLGLSLLHTHTHTHTHTHLALSLSLSSSLFLVL